MICSRAPQKICCTFMNICEKVVKSFELTSASFCTVITHTQRLIQFKSKTCFVLICLGLGLPTKGGEIPDDLWVDSVVGRVGCGEVA